MGGQSVSAHVQQEINESELGLTYNDQSKNHKQGRNLGLRNIFNLRNKMLFS